MAGIQRAERTKVMMKNFVTDYSNGMTIKEIAEKYSISPITVYRNLQEIAEVNGFVSREQFLKIIRTKVPDATWQRRHEETKKNLTDLKSDISKTIKHSQKLLITIKTIIDEEER